MSTPTDIKPEDIVNVASICLKTKRFLFWKYRVVEHDYKIHSIRKFMWCSRDYILEERCNKCGLYKERHFVTADELLLMGVTNGDIDKTGETHNYIKSIR